MFDNKQYYTQVYNAHTFQIIVEIKVAWKVFLGLMRLNEKKPFSEYLRG